MRTIIKPSVVLLTAALVGVLGLTAAGANVGGADNLLGATVTPTPKRTGSVCESTTSCLEALRASVSNSVVRKDPVLSWPLAQLVDADAVFWTNSLNINSASVGLLPKSLRDLTTARQMHINESGSVQVYIRTDGATSSLALAVEAKGVEIQRVAQEQGIIQALVPIRRLRAIAATPGITHVRLPDYGITQTGSVTSEGDALLNAAAARSSFGIDGSGVRVGVISDGVEGLAASQGSGDLPAVNTTTCDVGPGSPTASGAGAEGTAMLEIVHDLAPGAELWFGFTGSGFGGGTSLEFMDAVDCLADNVDVIVDDVAFFNTGPYDGTSPVSQNASDELNDPTNRVRGYYNAVGNQALAHYQAVYRDSSTISSVAGLHVFSSGAGTVDALGVGPDVVDPLLLLSGGGVCVALQWNDSFSGSSNDYDVALFLHDPLVLVATSGDPQTGSQQPVENFCYQNPGADAFFDIVISNFAASGAHVLDMFILCDACVPLPDVLIGQPIHNFNTRCSSVPNNSDAGGGVISLGAINASDPGADDIAPYSSCGPTNDGRTKPDAAAIDRVNITGNGGFPVPFSGTSAAAPHAGAVAALLLDCDPALTRTQLHDALLNTAVDLGASGPDNVFGHGRLNALAAATSVGCAAGGATATATATPTPTTGSVATATPTVTTTPTPTATIGPTNTPVPTFTPVPTSTPTPTLTPTAPPTATPTPTNTPRPASTRTPSPLTLVGDTSCDRRVDPLDAALILQLSAGMIAELPCPGGGDVSGDGVTNPLDAALILQFSARLISSLPP